MCPPCLGWKSQAYEKCQIAVSHSKHRGEVEHVLIQQVLSKASVCQPHSHLVGHQVSTGLGLCTLLSLVELEAPTPPGKEVHSFFDRETAKMYFQVKSQLRTVTVRNGCIPSDGGNSGYEAAPLLTGWSPCSLLGHRACHFIP